MEGTSQCAFESSVSDDEFEDLLQDQIPVSWNVRGDSSREAFDQPECVAVGAFAVGLAQPRQRFTMDTTGLNLCHMVGTNSTTEEERASGNVATLDDLTNAKHFASTHVRLWGDSEAPTLRPSLAFAGQRRKGTLSKKFWKQSVAFYPAARDMTRRWQPVDAGHAQRYKQLLATAVDDLLDEALYQQFEDGIATARDKRCMRRRRVAQAFEEIASERFNSARQRSWEKTGFLLARAAVQLSSHQRKTFEDFSVVVRLRRVNPWFVEWWLQWPEGAEPPPSEDICQNCPALRPTCRSTELSAIVCDRGDFVPQLLNLLRGDGQEAQETEENHRCAPAYLYKYVVRLLFMISEPLQHLPDPRFSTHPASNPHLLPRATAAADRIAFAEALTEDRLKELRHPWLKEEGVVVEPGLVADVSEDMDCLRMVGGEVQKQPVAVRFVAWEYTKNDQRKLCYLFVCPEEPALKKDGWRKPDLVDAAGWITHPLRRCCWPWPEEMEGIGPVDVRSMCCGDVPIYRRMIQEVAKPAGQLRDELGAMNVTDYRSFVLKALDYFAD
ncbi:unnamed protein product [Symbiodinium natans]|uniref:Uncharacterized protein n=1 Tax=Symbiodinium natans TaxID=878477 RepID=A0A812I3A0_9DINO|nr:unnamed protein product [Symbiodinium natans]